MKESDKTYLILTLFSCLPYLLVSWGYTQMVGGGAKELWTAFGVLVLARTFFSLIEFLGTVLMWHLYGKRIETFRIFQYLRMNDFPTRERADFDCFRYLGNIEYTDHHSASVKAAAKELYDALAAAEQKGMVIGMRMHSAADAALDMYSPK